MSDKLKKTDNIFKLKQEIQTKIDKLKIEIFNAKDPKQLEKPALILGQIKQKTQVIKTDMKKKNITTQNNFSVIKKSKWSFGKWY